MTSINTNIGAYFAQQNLRSANTDATNSIGRLSSGNRIVKASDDVAGLSVGTILRTNVSTLRAALVNTGQASSLLQVADGGLLNIGEILQRQKALSVQATAGTLSSAERSYLNQEFQNLRSEIDRLVENTKFNQVQLLNGSLSKATAITTNSYDAYIDRGADNTNDLTEINASATLLTLTTAGGVPANGATLTVNGLKIEFTTAAPGTSGGAGKVTIGSDITNTAANIVRFLNTSTDARVANLQFTSTGGAITAAWAGGEFQGLTSTAIVSASGTGVFTSLASNVTLTGTVEVVDGLSARRTFAVGDVVSEYFARGTANGSDSGLAIDVTGVSRAEGFVGRFGDLTRLELSVDAVGDDSVGFSMQIDDITYSVAATDVVSSLGPTAITLTGRDSQGLAKGGTIVLNLKLNALTANDVTSQAAVDVLEEKLNDALKNVVFVQNRDVTSFAGTIVTANGEEVARLETARVDFRSYEFEDVNVEGVTVTAPGFGETDGKIEVTINGEVYRSFSGIGALIEDNTLLSLQNVSDPYKSLTILLGDGDLATNSGYGLDIRTQTKADAVQAALEQAFGVADGNAKLQFQTGSTADDSIGIEIRSASAANLFNGLDADNFNILTVEDANAASDVLDDAIGYVTSLRADVGSAQSRFDYAAASLETSIQNVDAARSEFLDADISEEATMFAQAQVKLQASISVLAQANQLPQNLLKLIG